MSNIIQDRKGIENTIANILQTIVEGRSGDRILLDLAKEIAGWSQAEACIIVSQTAGKQHNQISCWQQKPHSWLTKDDFLGQLEKLPLNHDVIERVEESFQALLVDKTWRGITTQYQHQTNGLILLLKSNASEWTNTEQELLTLISDSMAIAISQAQLQQQTHTKSEYHSLLKNLSREISHSSHPASLFQNCLTQICHTLKLDRGMILMLKYQNPLQAKSRRGNKSIQGTVEIASQWSIDEDIQDTNKKRFFGFGSSDLCQQAWQFAPKYLCFESDTPFPDLDAEDLSGIKAGGEALTIMPLMGRQINETSPAVVWGFLVLQQNSPRHWTEDELDLIDWVSVQVGTAIVHHQTLNQVQSIVEERTAQLKWSLDVQAKLSEKMRQHIEQLQKLNQLKDDFMNSMSHELKTPLTSMKLAIMMLRQSQLPPEMREKYLNILEQEWNREYNLIKDLLTLQELESGELVYTPEELNLNQTIEQLANSFRARWQEEKGIELQVKISEADLKINTDAESLVDVLNELLLNAGKYSAADTKVELTAENRATLKGKNIVIAIVNYGAGITPEELPYIFDKFRRGAGVTDRAVPGTGLGLTLVQNLVEHLNGTIEVTSEPTAQAPELFATKFVLELPQFQPTIG
ncbi:MAG: ATP-binding protein [Cyanobacteria bacterium P01_G01_bin.19]